MLSEYPVETGIKYRDKKLAIFFHAGRRHIKHARLYHHRNAWTSSLSGRNKREGKMERKRADYMHKFPV